jgi:hypothetical protein
MTTVGSDGIVSVIADLTDGNITFGVELKNYQSNDCKFDHFTLEYMGTGSTGINDLQILNRKPSDSKCFDLQGRRLAHPVKGLNIVDGKKVVITR